MMERWLIGNKTAVLLCAAAAAHAGPERPPLAWVTLTCLVYLCLSLAIPIVRARACRAAFAALSAALVLIAAYRVAPAFLLLLPVSLTELAAYGGFRWRAALLASALSAFLVPAPMLPPYGLAALLSVLLFASVQGYAARLERQENESERLRAELHRLSRSLSESSELMRHSEYTIKLEERNRLSQRIHDEVGHSMAGALIQMEASRRLLESDPKKAAELLRNAIAISKEGLERIRMTLKDIKPRSEELGINRLRLLVERLAAKEAVAATLTHDGDLDAVTPIQWKVIHDNATEAVTNALRYSGATAINVDIRVLNGFVKAVVSDNGRGAEKVVKGMGIAGMEERAAAQGGTVVVDGTNGFCVTTLLPRVNGG